jgi:mannan endo-1,4-beta-mannosidase
VIGGARRRLLAAMVVVVGGVTTAVMINGCSTTSSAHPAASPSRPAPPRILLGAYLSLASVPDTEVAVERREAAMGRRYDLQITYYNWNDVFPDAEEPTIVAHGRTPVVTWYGPGKDPSDHRTLAEITNGSDDAWITQQAEAIKAFGHHIYLRLMPEMNGIWYPGFSGKPAAYVAAWRRIYRLFREVGVKNVTWVWCPNIAPAGWDPYYPGNGYVDVIGVDGFSNVKYGYQTFEQIFAPFLTHYAGRKPLLINEVATDAGVGSAAAGVGSAASFIDGMRAYLKDVGSRYRVIGVCWFDTDDTDHHDWRVDQTPASWQAWLALARDPVFGGKG